MAIGLEDEGATPEAEDDGSVGVTLSIHPSNTFLLLCLRFSGRLVAPPCASLSFLRASRALLSMTEGGLDWEFLGFRLCLASHLCSVQRRCKTLTAEEQDETLIGFLRLFLSVCLLPRSLPARIVGQR